METTAGVADDGLVATLEAALDDALSAGLILDATIATSQAQSAAIWRLRDSVSEANRTAGFSVSHDTSVPIPAIPEFVAEATAALNARASSPKVVAVGHVGDGNIHLVAIFARATAAIAQRCRRKLTRRARKSTPSPRASVAASAPNTASAKPRPLKWRFTSRRSRSS